MVLRKNQFLIREEGLNLIYIYICIYMLNSGGTSTMNCYALLGNIITTMQLSYYNTLTFYVLL